MYAVYSAKHYIWQCIPILCFCQWSLAQQYSYRQQLVTMPSKPCVGEAVTLPCEILVTIDNNTDLVSANINRGGEDVTSATVNHMLLRDGVDVVGVIVISVTLDDDGVEYTCGATGAPPNFESSLILNVTAPPTVPNITVPTVMNSRSFNVSWTITDPDHNYIVTWTNLRTGMMSSVTVPENTNSYMVTGLNGVDNYNVSVTANNSCGMMMSDPITVYDVPDAVTNVRIMDEDTTSESFVVLWDEVMDIFTVNYTVTWYDESGIAGMVTVNSPPYTVTGLTANTSYNVTVVAINTCCGAGPVSNVIVNTASTSTTPVLQRCTITSPSTNTIRASCELLEMFERIRVTISSNSCSCSQPVTMVGDNPITVPNLTTGVYTVEVIPVNSNNMSIENNSIVEIISLCGKSTAADESDSSTSSDGTVIAITCVVTLLVSVTVTAIVTSVIMYMLMKRKDKNTAQEDTTDKVLYEQVHSPSSSTTKNDPQCQKNPAYDVGGKVIMDTNPSYESYK